MIKMLSRDRSAVVVFSEPDGNGWVLQERPARD
jgi:hypothetical protein